MIARCLKMLASMLFWSAVAGAAAPLNGHCLFSDYCSGWLKSLRYQNGRLAAPFDWPLAPVGNVVSFGRDGQRELHVLSQAGSVFRIVRQ